MKNIPSNSLVLSDNAMFITDKRTVKLFKSGEITLSSFAIVQFICGALLFFKEKDFKIQSIDRQLDQYEFYVWLSELMMSNQSGNPCDIEVKYSELRTLKTWLVIRMLHCENERDNRSDKFNPDTYIGQKLLLIDIREIMMGQIID